MLMINMVALILNKVVHVMLVTVGVMLTMTMPIIHTMPT